MNFVTPRWRVYFVSHEVLWIDMQQRYVKTSSYCIFNSFMESRESCLAADGRAWKVDGRAQRGVSNRAKWCPRFQDLGDLRISMGF